MRAIAVVSGVIMVIVVLWEMFEAILLPRSVTRRLRLVRVYYRVMWRLWRKLSEVPLWIGYREGVLGAFGPMSLPLLMVLWALWLILGFSLVDWGLAAPFVSTVFQQTFSAYLYFSGTTFFTLGYGDMTPSGALTRAIATVEAGVGFAFLAIVIGYLPVIYQAFSRREVGISLLDARAGSPPTGGALLCRHAHAGQMPALLSVLQEWERWASDVLESHLSYPVLAYYRSQHDRESWLSALTAILDACALLMVSLEHNREWEKNLQWQASLTFAMARHTLVDLALIFYAPPEMAAEDRLSSEDTVHLYAKLEEAGLHLHKDAAARRELQKVRRQYEPYAISLGRLLAFPLPPWMPVEVTRDAWQATAWDIDSHF